jgi:AcrR family transcriptional regulator
MDESQSRIIEAGIQIMIELGDVRKVTMRDIADRAKVGLGLINYHFKTKEDLMRLAIRTFMNRVIGDWAKSRVIAPSSDPAENLRNELAEVSGFLAIHPRISRISILFDLESPEPGDNSARSISSLVPAIAATIGEGQAEASPTRAHEIATLIVGAMQHVFLRSPEGREFFDTEWRQRWIEGIVGLVAGRGNPAPRPEPLPGLGP